MKKVKFLVCVRDKNTGEIYQPGDIREFDDERAGELLIHTEATEEVYQPGDIREFDDERAGELLIHTEATEEVACEKPKKKAKVKDEK